jgi:sulfur transfer protein SufE
MNEALNTDTLISQLLKGDAQLSDEQHDAFLTTDRQLYATLLRLPNLLPETAMAIIQRLLAVTETSPGNHVEKTQRLQEDKLIVEILPHLPVATVLQGFSKLVERRVNNQRTSGWIRAYIFGAPQLESWAVTHRRALRKLTRHALGNPVTLTCLHKFAQDEKDEKTTAYLRHYVLRYAKDNAALVRDVFLFLFGKLKNSQFTQLSAYLAARQEMEAGKGLPLKVLQGLKGSFHPKFPKRRLRHLASREKTKREVSEEIEEADDSLVGRIRRYYRTAETAQLAQINEAIEQEAARIPDWDAHVYFIMDASDSMRGFGYRQYNNMAIAMGILKVFQKRIRQTQVAWIGAAPSDDDAFPQPAGATASAPALLEAVKQKPDVIILISDGYENVEQGDTAAVLAGIEQLGIFMPMLHIIPAFTERDRIEERQPLTGYPAFLETGQRGFLSTWLQMRAHLESGAVSTLLRQTIQNEK